MYTLVENYTLKKFKGLKNKKIIHDIEKLSMVDSAVLLNEENETILRIDYRFQSENEKNKRINNVQKQILKIIQRYEKNASFDIVVNKEVYRRVLYLKGLDCAHCASRIETIAKKQFNHEQIVVDFATGRFIIETTDEELVDDIEAEVTNVAHRVDPRIIVQDATMVKKEYKNEEEKKKVDVLFIVLFSIGVVALFTAIALQWDAVLEHILAKEEQSKPFWQSYGIASSICFIIAYILMSYKVLGKFFSNLFKGQFFDENLLMTVATIGAIVNSYYTEAIMIMVLFQIGEAIQEHAVNRSRHSIKSLLTIDVKRARLKVNNEVVEVDVESVLPGDVIRINKGEMIPLDGTLLSNRASLDTKNITGEYVHRIVKKNEEVLAGTINMSDVIEIKVTKIYSDSMITKILDSVENASAYKAKSEKFITKFSKIYTPVVVGLAITVAVVGFLISWLIYQNTPTEALEWVYRATIFLVISCPCALVISIPLCYFSGIGVASSDGILIKGSNYLESLSNAKEVVFDKTGTITKGEFKINDVVIVDPAITENDIKKYIIYTEYYSNHPIGIALVEGYGRNNVFTEIISDFREIQSRGAQATINNNQITIGNGILMEELGIKAPSVEGNGLVIHVAKNNKYIGYVIVGDEVKENASETVINLRKRGIEKIALLTGDSEKIGQNVGNIIGADDVYCNLLPVQKVEKLQELKGNIPYKNGRVVYVGDGLNDAPVISSADIGVAMGSNASDATIEVSDVVIMSEDIGKIDDLILIAKKTKHKVIQNIVFSLIVKICIMICSVIPAITVPVWIAVFADVGVSLIAIANSMWLLRLFRNRQKQTLKEIKDENEE